MLAAVAGEAVARPLRQDLRGGSPLLACSSRKVNESQSVECTGRQISLICEGDTEQHLSLNGPLKVAPLTCISSINNCNQHNRRNPLRVKRRPLQFNLFNTAFSTRVSFKCNLINIYQITIFTYAIFPTLQIPQKREVGSSRRPVRTQS